MFLSKVEIDAFGIKKKHYYLTQGDSQYIYIVPKNQDGEIVVQNITTCEFKLGNTDLENDKYPIVYSKVLEKQTDKLVLSLTSEETSGIDVDTYKYQFDFNFIDGSKETVQGFFTITPVVG